jgi:ParB-like chromosome segregation protein Spo0J
MSLALEESTILGFDYSAQELPIEFLRAGQMARSGALDELHVRVLMETADGWPPIVVWSDDCVVIDGAHRVEAARRLGRPTLIAVRFIGTRDEAYLESVRRNVTHGLPLSLDDRRRAALRFLKRNPEWSDRRLASLCGLSGKSVARLRREAARSDGMVGGIERRLGRDGKLRPVQSEAVRDRIRRALKDNPTGSLRVIAAAAGASPETVRTVKARLMDSVEPTCPIPLPPTKRTQKLAGPILCQFHIDEPVHEMAGGATEAWIGDAALITSADGGDFARWFASNKVDDEWHRFVWTVPKGRIYEVVDEARRRAASWIAFASMLENRVQ